MYKKHLPASLNIFQDTIAIKYCYIDITGHTNQPYHVEHFPDGHDFLSKPVWGGWLDRYIEDSVLLMLQ